MISWMTIVILSAPRRSTSGRAPWFSAIIRFWISVESLNRPPTLFTISSSLSSSSIEGYSSSTTIQAQNIEKRLDRRVELVVDQLNVVPVGLGKLFAGLDQAALNRGLAVRTAVEQTLGEGTEAGRLDEHEQRSGYDLPDLHRPRHFNLQQNRLSRLKRI